nr:MAG TPA: Terminase large subunit [Caudoviricetes sp.]
MKIPPELYLKFAKDIEPEIFENKTPKFHLDVLKFIDGADQHKAVVIFRGSAKTTLLNKIYVVSRLYFYAEPFIMIASANDTKAKLFVEAIKNSIDKAAAKGYAIERGKIWNKDRIEVVVNRGKKDRNGNDMERTCHVVSLSSGQDPRGANIDNMRPTLIIVDDLESKDGQFPVGNKASRQKLRGWFYADLLPAVHPTRGKVVVLGTILHEDSILNNIVNNENIEETSKQGWRHIKIPIIENGASAWPSRFPLSRIKAIQNQLVSKGLANEFYQEYMCAAIDPQRAIFKREYFRYFERVEYDISAEPEALNITDGVNIRTLQIRKAINLMLGGEKIELAKCQIFTTIDLASANGRDQTAMITSAVDNRNRIFIIDISAGHWTPFEKSVEIIRIFQIFGCTRIGIEKAGMQNDFFYTIDIIQKMTGVHLPIDQLSHGGKAKNTRISNLEPYYRTGQIYHNASIDSSTELEAQLLSFDSEVESKEDDLMDALAYLQQYIVGREFDEPDYEDEDYEGAEAWA